MTLTPKNAKLSHSVHLLQVTGVRQQTLDHSLIQMRQLCYANRVPDANQEIKLGHIHKIFKPFKGLHKFGGIRHRLDNMCEMLILIDGFQFSVLVINEK